MAEFVEVMRHKVRMCKQAVTCEKCPMSKEFWEKDFCFLPREQCHSFVGRHPDKAEPIIMDWAAKHPEKTMKDVFFERFPNAVKRDNGRPGICLKWLGFTPIRADCSVDCADCWNQPAPEE